MAVVQTLSDVVASLQTEVAALAARIPVGGATPAEQAALAATIQTQVDAIKAMAPSV